MENRKARRKGDVGQARPDDFLKSTEARACDPGLNPESYGGAMDQGRQAGRIGRGSRVTDSGGTRSGCSLSVLAYNLGNLWRRLMLPKRVDSWSLISVQQRLVQDRWAYGEACAVLLAAVGGESPDPTPVRGDASADLGAADPDGPNRRTLTGESGEEAEQGWKAAREMSRN